jgi:iron complex transport system substrate-binding protein
MKKIFFVLNLVILVAFSLVGCNSNLTQTITSSQAQITATSTQVASTPEKKVITYLGVDYKLPSTTNKIVITGSLESMEDALVLGVEPTGAITAAGKFSELFAPITTKTLSTGEKSQPDFEAIIAMKPDVILGSSKFPDETKEKLNKIAVTIPVSHLSNDWEANLMLLGQLSGKEDKAKSAIEAYKAELSSARASLASKIGDQKVLALRIRKGVMYTYSETTFFNPSLYTDLGFKTPDAIKATKAQESISLEALTQINPDHIFLQFDKSENADNLNALEDLNKNPIWNSLQAVKGGHVYVNVVDPIAQGGTSYSKISFLKAAVEKLSK